MKKNKSRKAMRVSEALRYAEDQFGEVFHHNTFLSWLNKGKLKGYKIGGEWRICKDALDDFFCPDFGKQTKPVCNGEAA
jgi:excisionase family DNA binding protein